MKKAIFFGILLSTLISLSAFDWSTSERIYDHLLDDTSRSEKLFTSNSNTALMNNLSQFFASKLDIVERVDVHWGIEKEYYFCVYGKKNGIATVQQVLVSEGMACHQRFPSLAQMGIEANAFIVNCYWEKVEIDDETIRVCSKIDAGVVCGVSPSGDLCVQIRDYEEYEP